MKFIPSIQSAQANPADLENLYQSARHTGEEAEFRADLFNLYENSPDNLLYAAWHYRLQNTPLIKARRGISWGLAAALGVVTGLIFWALSDVTSNSLLFLGHLPYLILLWAPIASLLALVFLTVTPRQHYRRALIVGAGLVAVCAYVMLIAPSQAAYQANTYLDLMALHLPLLAWVALGLVVLGWGSRAPSRFSFLIKSFEVVITAGLYLMAGMAFGGITMGLFLALNVRIPDVISRLIIAGGFGLLPVLAVASVYDPQVPPEAQDFSQGLSKFIAMMMRLLLPLTLVVLVVYICFIPFNFMAPFETREVLIVYNVMLFAILGLLLGATPVKADELSPRLQQALRYGFLAVAGLAVLISIYALSAVIYRTVLDHITINRLTVIGWNGINIGILIALITSQVRRAADGWEQRLQAVFSQAAVAYLIWTVLLVVAIPLLFR